MPESGGLAQFGDSLHPQVLADLKAWEGNANLAKLNASLRGHTTLRSFLDSLAEALVARHLLARGCALRFEVPIPTGKACDFEVRSGDQVFYLHVKRLDTDRPARRRLTISSRLRYLERIQRPYVVSVRWREGAADEQMQRLVRSARDFILHARVGDELVVHDDDGLEIGGVLIVAPWEGDHVSLAIGLPSGFIDESARVRKLLRRAYKQFMPRAANVILIATSNREEHEDFENALLGSHVERWDAYPPRGQRIAFGRAADGFWSSRRYADSWAAGWFPLQPQEESIHVRLWYRAPARDSDEENVRRTLSDLFGEATILPPGV